MSITAQQRDDAVVHNMAHGAMALDDPLTTMATEVALHHDWPAADQANYRAIASQMATPAADAAAQAGDMWFIERPHPWRWTALYLAAIAASAGISAWLDAMGWSAW